MCLGGGFAAAEAHEKASSESRFPAPKKIGMWKSLRVLRVDNIRIWNY